MKRYVLLLGAALLAAPITAQAAPASDNRTAPASIAQSAIPAPWRAEPARERPVRLAQVADPRVLQLEEQVRQLNGRIEELNFQLLQMQEQMRKQQEDFEFRFQQLEQKEGNAGTSDRKRDTVATDEVPMDMPSETDVADTGDASTRGAPARDLGQLKVDENGNLLSGRLETPTDLLGNAQARDETAPGDATDDTTVAALPATDDPEELYSNAYQFILSGDYRTAEAGFRDYSQRFPEGSHIADAQYWLGESLLGQDRYEDAAQVFLDASKAYPQASKAPDTLLKLGISLAAMQKTDIACATYDTIPKRYPGMSQALAQRVAQEKALAGC